MAVLFHDKQLSVGFRDQSDFQTPAADGTVANWSWLATTTPEISLARETEDLGLASPQPMAELAPVVGSQFGGTFKITFPLSSQADAYDPTAAPPVVTPEMALFRDCIGSAVTTAYTADGVAAAGGGDANALTLDTGGDLVEGAAYIFGAGTTPRSIGWVKAVDTLDVDLIEDMAALVVNADEIFPMVTVYASAAQPTPRTFRMVGAGGQDVRFVGCIPTKLEMPLEAGKVITVTVTFTFLRVDYATIGSGPGLQVPTQFGRVPALLGDHGARLTLNGIASQDGTAKPHGSCDVVNVSLTVDLITRATKCHGSNQGVGDVEVVDRKLSIAATIPYSDEYTVAGVPTPELSFQEGTGISFSLEAGDTFGQMFALLVPNMLVKDQWNLTSDNGVYAVSFNGVAGTYDGDGAAASPAAPANAVFRAAFG
jgi:hypothetical protein